MCIASYSCLNKLKLPTSLAVLHGLHIHIGSHGGYLNTYYEISTPKGRNSGNENIAIIQKGDFSRPMSHKLLSLL
jgi:hypothetical protein